MENEGGTNLMKFGENLYNLRKSAKMSQEKLAEKNGCIKTECVKMGEWRKLSRNGKDNETMQHISL